MSEPAVAAKNRIKELLADPLFEKGLNVLQIAVAVMAFVLCLQGKGSIITNIILAACIPGLRWIFDAGYRQRFNAWLGDLWLECVAFPTARDRIPSRAVIVLLLIPLTILYCVRGLVLATGDSKPVALTAASLILEKNWEIGEYFKRKPEQSGLPYYLMQTPDGIYSNYPSGMVAFALPVAVSARLMGAHLDQPKVRDRVEKLTATAVAVASVGLFFVIALHLAPAGPALMATLFVALGSAMFTTVAQGLWQHDGVIFFALLILLVEFRAVRRRSALDLWIQGMACAMMLACRMSSVLFIVPFGLWVAFRSPRRAVAIALVSAAFYLPWAALYWSIYGNLFGPSSGQMSARLWSAPGAEIASVLLSPGRGLLVYQPWILLAFFAVIPAVRRQKITLAAGPVPSGWMLLCLMVTLFYLVVASSWGMWWGGYSWGSRLVCEAIPLLGLVCLPGIHFLSRNRPGRVSLAVLFVVSLLMHLPVVYFGSRSWNERHDVDNHPESLWSWSDAPFLSP